MYDVAPGGGVTKPPPVPSASAATTGCAKVSGLPWLLSLPSFAHCICPLSSEPLNPIGSAFPCGIFALEFRFPPLSVSYAAELSQFLQRKLPLWSELLTGRHGALAVAEVSTVLQDGHLRFLAVMTQYSCPTAELDFSLLEADVNVALGSTPAVLLHGIYPLYLHHTESESPVSPGIQKLRILQGSACSELTAEIAALSIEKEEACNSGLPRYVIPIPGGRDSFREFQLPVEVTVTIAVGGSGLTLGIWFILKYVRRFLNVAPRRDT